MRYESPASEDARIDVSALLGAVVRQLPRIVLVTLGLLVVTFVILMFQPRLYESSAAILVEPRANAYVRASGDQAPQASQGNAAGVISSQIELIRSRDTLLNVIDQVDLRSVPEFNGSNAGPSPLAMVMQLAGRRSTTPVSVDETVLTNLYDRMTVVQERDSAIISVLVRSTDPQLASDIANAVANAHVARRAELSLSDTAEASTWLRTEIDRLRVSVQEAESAVAEFRVENDLFVVGQNNTSLLDQQLSTIAGQITAAQERRSAAMSRATLIRGMIERSQPVEGAADVRDSAVIQQLSQEKGRLQGELAQRSATLLSNHPTIRALNAQIAELDNQIRIEGQRVAAALEAEAQIEADLETSLRADLDRARSSASTATRDTVALDGLEREAAAQRDLLEAYLLRYNEASSRVDAESALPDVRVVSVAAPSVSPASPRTSLVMVAVGIVALAVQLGAVAFGELMSGRALAPVHRPAPVVPQDELEAMPFDESELEPEQRWQTEEPEVTFADETMLDEPAIVTPEVELEPFLVATSDPLVEPEERVEPMLDEALDAEPEPDVEATRAFIRSLMANPPSVEDPEVDDGIGEMQEDLAAEPEFNPELEPVVATTVTEPPRLLRYTDLVSDLVLGRTHLLLLADHGNDQPARLLAEEICGDALAKGLSVALIDAGTGIRSDNPGLTDLSTGAASFGDVVQKSADNSFAEVTWGQGDAIDPASSRPLTLAEALGDIYEVVVVLTGEVGGTSTLMAFAELGGRIVIVTGDETDADLADHLRRTLEADGLERVEIAALAEPVAA